MQSSDVLVAAAFGIVDRVTGGPAGGSRLAALNVLAAFPGSSVAELAADLGLSHSATVRLVDQLARQELVERRPAGRGRLLALALTDRGRREAARIAQQRDAVLDVVADALTEAERRAFLSAVAKVAVALLPDGQAADTACRLCDQQRCVTAGCALPTASKDELVASRCIRHPRGPFHG